MGNEQSLSPVLTAIAGDNYASDGNCASFGCREFTESKDRAWSRLGQWEVVPTMAGVALGGL